jgi:hypothetical protein
MIIIFNIEKRRSEPSFIVVCTKVGLSADEIRMRSCLIELLLYLFNGVRTRRIVLL